MSKQRRTVLSAALAPIASEPVPADTRIELPAKRKAKADVIQQTLYLPNSVHEQLRQLAFSERVKMHDIVMRALDREFMVLGLKSIDELKLTQ
jgi:hypothetical protein